MLRKGFPNSFADLNIEDNPSKATNFHSRRQQNLSWVNWCESWPSRDPPRLWIKQMLSKAVKSRCHALWIPSRHSLVWIKALRVSWIILSLCGREMWNYQRRGCGSSFYLCHLRRSATWNAATVADVKVISAPFHVRIMSTSSAIRCLMRWRTFDTHMSAWGCCRAVCSISCDCLRREYGFITCWACPASPVLTGQGVLHMPLVQVLSESNRIQLKEHASNDTHLRTHACCMVE